METPSWHELSANRVRGDSHKGFSAVVPTRDRPAISPRMLCLHGAVLTAYSLPCHSPHPGVCQQTGVTAHVLLCVRR